MEAARLRRARARRESGMTLIEGPHSLEAALSAGIEVERIFALSDDEVSHRIASEWGLRILAVTSEVLAKVADTQSPRGPVTVVHIPQPSRLTGDRLVVLWEISDPGNVGTMIRSAAALGFDVSVRGGADLWSPKVLRSAASAQFQTRLSWSKDLSVEQLQSAGYRVVASVVEDGRRPDELAPEARTRCAADRVGGSWLAG